MILLFLYLCAYINKQKTMKKALLFVAVISAFSVTSCKKDRTCTCTDSTGGSSVRIYTKSKKSQAEAACLSYTETYNSVTVTTTCSLSK